MSILNTTIEKIMRILEQSPHSTVTGEARAEHPHHWVSALHLLTEDILGQRIHLVSERGVNNTYTVVSQAVLWMEREGFVAVQRAHGSLPCQANGVEAIRLM